MRLRRLSYTQLSHLTRYILKQGMVALCGISLLCQQVVAVPVFSGNTVKQIHHPQVVAYHYDAWSRLTNRTLLNGISTVYRYDQYSGVSNITHYQTLQQQKVVTEFTYIYNQDCSIRQRVRINGLGQKAIEQYGYDDNNNLKDYQCSGTLCPHDAQGKVITYQHYTFDGFNNIKTVASNNTLTTYEYDQQIPTRLIGYHNSNPAYPSSQRLRYDLNGNIVQDNQGNVMTYDPLDQTHSVSTKQGIATYFYNGEGQQVGEGIPSRQTMYFMYGQSTLLNTRAGSQQTSFLYGANRLGKQDDEGTQYYLTDQGQSVVNTINQTQGQGQNINSYAYSPYGIESNLTKQPGNANPTQHFGFDGQLTDSQTHWQFLGQGYRAYNPMLHRFMSQDSMSPFDKGGINGYVFGSNNPIMMSDPTGHMSFWANMGIGLSMGIAASMLTSEMGGWGALALNALAGAVGSNIDAIDNAVHGKAINWKSVGINAGISAALGVFGGKLGRENPYDEYFTLINNHSGVQLKKSPSISTFESVMDLYKKLDSGSALRLRSNGVDYIYAKGYQGMFVKTWSDRGVIEVIVAKGLLLDDSQSEGVVSNIGSILDVKMGINVNAKIIGEGKLTRGVIDSLVSEKESTLPRVYKTEIDLAGNRYNASMSVAPGSQKYTNSRVYAGYFIRRPYDRLSLFRNSYLHR